MTQLKYQVAVVGGGPAGLAAALAIRRLGFSTALVGPVEPVAQRHEDRRTAALFPGSIQLLRNLGAWDAVQAASEPIHAIRIIDDRGALLRPPEVLFSARDAGCDVFGWNVPNGALVESLRAATGNAETRIDVFDTTVSRLDIAENSARISLADDRDIVADLVVGADGRRSSCRDAAGIASKAWTYPQSALTCSFEHARPHNGISTEFHRLGGPFTLVPMRGRASSLVWVEHPDEAARLAALDIPAFRSAVEERLQGLLGSVGDIGPRTLFPLSGLSAMTFAANRVALVGEAAHVMPPIGAQGLNLGLTDAAVLADTLAAARREARDIGSAATLQAYNEARRADAGSRMAIVDLLNRSLLTGLVPVHLARGLGLHILKAVGPLRRAVVREGLRPSLARPSLMQPDAP